MRISVAKRCLSLQAGTRALPTPGRRPMPSPEHLVPGGHLDSPKKMSLLRFSIVRSGGRHVRRSHRPHKSRTIDWGTVPAAAGISSGSARIEGVQARKRASFRTRSSRGSSANRAASIRSPRCEARAAGFKARSRSPSAMNASTSPSARSRRRRTAAGLSDGAPRVGATPHPSENVRAQGGNRSRVGSPVRAKRSYTARPARTPQPGRRSCPAGPARRSAAGRFRAPAACARVSPRSGAA